jgi:lysophospholipase L1-like esterase
MIKGTLKIDETIIRGTLTIGGAASASSATFGPDWIDDTRPATKDVLYEKINSLEVDGVPGADGDSAYEIAVAGGFVGTEAEWLNSLIGPEGPQGPQGNPGADGLPGADGAQGPQGIQGIQGDAGPAGADGLPGADGADGAQGPQGEIGPQGPQGLQGPQGIQGPAGADGADGADGTSFTVDAVGLFATRSTYDNEAEGFAFLASDTGDLYIREGALGNWSIAIPFQGPKGDTGDTGPQGIQGEQGPQGIQGIQGDVGPQGLQGVQGVAGNDGADGIDGLSAYQIAVNEGFVGTEAEWLASLQGADGADGADGAQGIQGIQGIQGEQGIQGLPGNDGADGTDGADGQGVPVGGTAGQILKKVDETDFNTEWADETGGGAPVVEITTITKYNTVADLPAITGTETDTYAYVTTDTDKNNNGLYCIAGGVWKLLYAWDDESSPVIKTSPNLINTDYVFGGTPTDSTHEGIIEGYRLNLNSPALVSSASQFITDFIPVRFGDKLYKINSTQFWWYDKDKQPMLEADVPYNYGDSFVVNNADCKYIRWTISNSVVGVTDMIVKHSSTIKAEVAGWQDIHEGYQRDNTHFVYEDEGVIFKKPTNNLLDRTTVEFNGGYIDTNGNYQTPSGNSGYIEVKPNTPYKKSGNNSALAWFDKDKVFISGVTTTYAVSPSTAKYLMWYISPVESVETTIIQQGIAVSPLYYKDVSTDLLKNTISEKQSVCFIGDSITTEASTYAQVGYPSIVNDVLNLETLHNVAVSGRALENLRTDIDNVAYGMPQADVYAIFLGTNDFGYNRPLGTLADTSSSGTVCGSMQGIYEQLLVINPNAKIVWFTPIQRSIQDTQNSQAAILKDYRNIIIQKADSLGCEYLDLWNTGVNVYNSKFITDWFVSADGTHLNDEGHKAFLYPKIVKFIKEVLNDDSIGLDTADRLEEDNAITGTKDIDWSLYESFKYTLTGAVTLSDINLPPSGSKTITLMVTGDFAITYPTGWDSTFVNGTYDGTVLNQIVVQYVKAATPYYVLQISQPQ